MKTINFTKFPLLDRNAVSGDDRPEDVSVFINFSARKPIGQLCCRWKELPLYN